MANSDPVGSPLQTAAGPDATDAFGLLSSDARLAIMLALWDAHDPHATGNAVPFSDLRERVGMRDSGQFNYHLGKLEGPYVRKTDAGYALQPMGLELVGTVIAGIGPEDALDRSVIDYQCDLCGGPTAITYRDGWLFHVCTECEGGLSRANGFPTGTLFAEPFPPAALGNRTAEEIFAAGVLRLLTVMAMKMSGLCPRCSGLVERSVRVCEDHDRTAEGTCETCEYTTAVRIHWVCTVCKYRGSSSPSGAMIAHPAVVAFYHDHGVDLGYGINEFERARQTLKLLRNHEETLRSTDPLRLDVIVSYDGDELRLTLDGAMNVIESDRSGRR